MLDFANLIGPSLLKTCTNCGGSGRPIRWPYMPCEPCDGSGMVPNADGRALLGVLGDGRFRLGLGEIPGVTS